LAPFTYDAEQLRQWADRILELLERSGPMSSAEVWLGLGGTVPDAKVTALLNRLVAEGRATAETVTRRSTYCGGRRSGECPARVFSAAGAGGRSPKPERRKR
jgi:hypothetical protein